MSRSSPIIVALDVPTAREALDWSHRLAGRVAMVKVGMQLFYAEGPDLVRRIHDQGVGVFLDLKLHDIPNTVASACRSLMAIQPELLTVHISGGLDMLEAAQSVVSGSNTQLLGITALTSLDQTHVSRLLMRDAEGTEISIPEISPAQWATHLAGLAKESGLFGIVCSAQENTAIRAKLGDQLALVNPGIRLPEGDVGDQKRVASPGRAIEDGAHYLVVGRPILTAADPLAVIDAIHRDIQTQDTHRADPRLPA